MPTHKVTILPNGATLEVDPAGAPFGRDGRPGSLLDIALAHGVEIEHSCGGHGACGACHVLVEAGAENLSEPEDDELDVLERVPGNALNSRLACRAVVRGDVTVTVRARGGDSAEGGSGRREQPPAAGLKWSDADEIGRRLHQKMPGVDPLTVRFGDLRRWVLELEGFGDDPAGSSEPVLEHIQMAWLAHCRQDG
jgi:2Fe-2S ferredoxin